MMIVIGNYLNAQVDALIDAIMRQAEAAKIEEDMALLIREEAEKVDRLIETEGDMSLAIDKIRLLLQRLREHDFDCGGSGDEFRSFRLAQSALRDLERTVH